jgi:hypothetical protein
MPDEEPPAEPSAEEENLLALGGERLGGLISRGGAAAAVPLGSWLAGAATNRLNR